MNWAYTSETSPSRAKSIARVTTNELTPVLVMISRSARRPRPGDEPEHEAGVQRQAAALVGEPGNIAPNAAIRPTARFMWPMDSTPSWARPTTVSVAMSRSSGKTTSRGL